MIDTVKALLRSKKFLVAVVAAVVWVAGKAGLHLDNTELLGAVTPLWTYVLGQGIADGRKLPA